MRNTCVFWIFLILMAMVSPCVAEGAELPEEYQLVRDCKEEWLVYSQEYQNYVPFVRSLHESERSVSIWIDPVMDRHFTFMLKTRRSSTLFVDGALQRNLVPDEWVVLSCDSLYQRYGRKKVVLTVFGQRGIDGISSYMVFPRKVISPDSLQVFNTSLVSLKPKSANVYRDFSVIAWLLILSVSAIVFASVPDTAYKMANPIEFFSRDLKSELYNHHRAYSPLIVFGVVVLSLISAFLLISVEMNVAPVLPSFLAMSGGDSVGSVVIDFSILTLLCFFVFYVKYLVIYITLGMLNYGELSHIHFIKSLQSSLLFYGALSVFLLFGFFQFPRLLPGLGGGLLWLVTIFYGTRYLILYILLNHTGRVINLYLISYLCVVELFPLIIGIKYLM